MYNQLKIIFEYTSYDTKNKSLLYAFSSSGEQLFEEEWSSHLRLLAGLQAASGRE